MHSSNFSQKVIRSGIWLLVFGLITFGAIRLYFAVTDGFTIGNISSSLPYNPKWEVASPLASEQQEINVALDQPYRYFAKGHQAYVFLSEDGNYVIKFIKFQRIRVHPFLMMLPLPNSWEEWRQEKVVRRQLMQEELFESWRLGFESFKDESALLMVHLNPTTDIHKQLHITDKLGMTHVIDLDQTVFLIQRRGVLATTKIQEAMSAKDENQAREVIDSLLELFISEYHRGVTERDQYIERNAGFVQGRPIHIDTGRFVYDASLKKPEVYKRELRWKMRKFDQWLQARYPSLSSYLQERLNTLT